MTIIEGALVGAVASPALMWGVWGLVKFCKFCNVTRDKVRWLENGEKRIDSLAEHLSSQLWQLKGRVDALEKKVGNG